MSKEFRNNVCASLPIFLYSLDIYILGDPQETWVRGGLSFLSFTEDVGMGASAVKGNDTDFGVLLV